MDYVRFQLKNTRIVEDQKQLNDVIVDGKRLSREIGLYSIILYCSVIVIYE